MPNHDRFECQTAIDSDAILHMSAYQARHYLMCLEKEGKIRRTPLRRGARTLWEVVREAEKY
ncbi:FaeA/PapI family transcriptional regulator [Escherichia coli]|nr:FaeA/PapI family transcriptional regulator [Escherichia coli]